MQKPSEWNDICRFQGMEREEKLKALEESKDKWMVLNEVHSDRTFQSNKNFNLTTSEFGRGEVGLDFFVLNRDSDTGGNRWQVECPHSSTYRSFIPAHPPPIFCSIPTDSSSTSSQYLHTSRSRTNFIPPT